MAELSGDTNPTDADGGAVADEPDDVGAASAIAEWGLKILFVPLIGPLLVLLIFVPSWRPGPEFTAQSPAGFWSGCLHGLLWPLTYLVALFSDGDSWSRVYEFDSDSFYPVGFGIGFVAMAVLKLIQILSPARTTTDVDSNDAHADEDCTISGR